MKNLTCVWRNIYNTARATHSRYYKHFAKHACDFSLILLEPCNFLYKFKSHARLETFQIDMVTIQIRSPVNGVYMYIMKHMEIVNTIWQCNQPQLGFLRVLRLPPTRNVNRVVHYSQKPLAIELYNV